MYYPIDNIINFSLDCNENGSSNNQSSSQGVEDTCEEKIGQTDDNIPESKELRAANDEGALIKKIGKKIRLRKKKKREAKQKKTENRAKKALKTIR